MKPSFVSFYSALALVLGTADFALAWRAFQKKDRVAHFLGLSAFSAGMVTFSYLVSVLTRNDLAASIASSVYFAGIDWMLVAVIHFAYVFTRLHLFKTTKIIRACLRGYALLDSAVFLVNIFTEIAVGYTRRDTLMARYVYVMKPLYFMHLAFTYLLVIIALVILIEKCVQTPRQYRSQYLFIILAIVVVVLLNAVFLYPDTSVLFTQVDCSVFGYSVGLLIMFWAAFSYRRKHMMKALSMTVFQNIDQGIVLFDHMDQAIMHNRKAELLLPEVDFEKEMDRAGFLKKCGLSGEAFQEDRHSAQCEKNGQNTWPLRCDFTRLRDDSGLVTGNLYVFTDEADEVDITTGFPRGDVFLRFAQENPAAVDYPAAVAVFDLMGLGEMNRNMGWEAGNERIRALSRLIRGAMPEDTFFIRGYEAHLIAVCRDKREKDIEALVRQAAEAAPFPVLYGLSETAGGRDENSNVVWAIHTAVRVMQTKKLLSAKSFHSQTVASLVQALLEADSDTEAHVQRTQKMGEALGRRIGLNDAQLADLKLLCLLHDIGKIGIPLEILNKPGKLSEQEWVVMRTHAEKGSQIAKSSEELRPLAPLILSHHEQWDGTGYPEQLKGEAIPILSRIISLVDSYDAMVNDRVYRKALPPEEAQAEIRRCAGTQFDPALAEQFLDMLLENPGIAAGEKTGGSGVRLRVPSAPDAPETGNTSAIPYSRYLLDMDEKIVEIDSRFSEITGYGPEEALNGLSQFDLLPPEDRAFYITQVNEAFTRGNIAYLKHEILRRDGKVVWVVCFGRRYYDSAVMAYRSEIVIFRTLEKEAGEKA